MLLESVASVSSQSTLQTYFDDHSRTVLRQHLWSVADADHPLDAELRLNTTEGQPECWVRIESSVSSNGEYRSALIDISAQKNAEAERLELAGQLRQAQKMEVMHRLSAGIAHDFNNVLQVIQAYGELIQNQSQQYQQIRQHADALLTSTQRGADLTKRLLAFSRKSSLQAKPADLRQIVENGLAVIRRLTGEDITVRATFPNSPVPCLADAHLVEQAILNLCVNARDAMPDGGNLNFTVAERHFDDAAVIGGMQIPAGTYASLQVMDDGMGISDDTLPRVFEPFFTTRSVGEGTGLGLSIVYGIVRQHKGAIQVESKTDLGTTFTIFLPTAALPADIPVKHEQSRPPSRHVGTILLAEDEEAIRTVLATILSSAGYTVLLAHDGASAIKQLETHAADIDLLLTDIVMPNGSGKDVCEVFHDMLPQHPVVFLTGHGDGVIDRDFLNLHDAVLLNKPLDTAQLRRTVSDRLKRRLLASA